MANNFLHWDVVEVGLCTRTYLDRRWPISSGEAHALLLGKQVKHNDAIQVKVWGDPGPIDLTCICHVRTSSPMDAEEDDLTCDLKKLSINSTVFGEQEVNHSMSKTESRTIGPDTLVIVHTLLKRDDDGEEFSLHARFYQSALQLPYMQQQFSSISTEKRRVIIHSDQGEDCCTYDLVKMQLKGKTCFAFHPEDAILLSKTTRPERLLEDLFYAARLTNGFIILDEAESVWSEPEPISEYWQMYCSLVSLLNEYPAIPVICLGSPAKFIQQEMLLNRWHNELGFKEIELRSPLGIQEWSILFKELFAFENFEHQQQQLASQSSGLSLREVCEVYCQVVKRHGQENDDLKWDEFKKRMMELNQSQKSRVTIGTDVPFTFIPATTTTTRMDLTNYNHGMIKPTLDQKLNEFCPSVIGQIKAKRALFECLILPRLFPVKMKQLGLKHPIRGMVLYGPPGAGKTMLVAAASQQAGFHLLSVSASDLVRGDVGGTEKRVSKLFSLARSCAPCVLFFDEADGLLINRNDAGPNGKKMVAQFILEMDELNKLSSPQSYEEQVVIIAATNSLEKVDVSFFRPGRLERRVHVGKLTTKEEMIQAFKSLSEGKENFLRINWQLFFENNFDSIMRLISNQGGLTGAQIGQILMTSIMECEKRVEGDLFSLSGMEAVVKEHQQSTMNRFVGESDLMIAIKKTNN